MDQISELKKEIEKLREQLHSLKRTGDSLDPRILEAVISNIGTGFIVSDVQGNIMFQNDASQRMHDFRYEHEELTHLNEFKKTFTLEYPEGGVIPFEKWPLPLAIKGDYFRDYLVKLVNPQSRGRKLRFISYNTVPIYDKEGTKKYIIITMTDLTEIRESTQQLNESRLKLAGERELFEGIFNNIPVMITIYDPGMKSFRVNSELTRVLGWTEEDAAAGNFMELVYPDPVHRQEAIDYMQSLEGGWKELRPVARDGTEIISTWANIRLASGIMIGIGLDVRKRKQDEEVLRKNEQRLRSIFGNAAIGIVEVDTRERILEVNERACDILGYNEDELIGRTIHEITAPEDRQLSVITNEKIRKGEKGIIDYEKRYLKKDNTKIWVHVTVSGVYNTEGQHIHSVGTIEDISERRLSQQALRRSESILKQAGMMANLGAWEIEFVTDDITKNPLHWSEQVFRIFGYPPGSVEVDNTLFYERVHPDDRAKVREAVENALKTRQSYTVEHRIIRLDGTIRFVIENAEVYFDGTGKPLKMIGAVQDITERKKAEESLKESEEKFRSVFENVIEGIALHSVIYENDIPVDFSIIDTNKAFIDHFGHEAELLKDKPATEFYLSKGLPVKNEYFDVAKSGSPYKFEASPGANKHFIINVISPKEGQFATVFEDITEHKRNELEIRKKNEELTRFIYTVSHDLKSPLVTIKSFSNYLQEDIRNNDQDAQDRDLNFIRNAADRMARLLDELLELSRIGRKEKPKVTIPLEEVVLAARDLVAGRLEEKKTKVTVTGIPVMLYGHAQRFIQLFQNLIDNSAKFTGDQQNPFIEIGAYPGENNEVVIFVRDNGKGIDPRYHHKIFGLFEKMDVETEGTGIGLALVKRIVEVHGGTIWFISEGNGKGTTFYFTLEGTTIIK
ncbi:MAG: PAS domain S-box protein [Chloroflexota bacterium]